MDYSADNIIPVGHHAYLDSDYIFRPLLIKKILDCNGEKVHEDFSCNGTLIKPINEVTDYILSRGGKLVISSGAGFNNKFIFKWEDAYLALSFNKKNNSISFSMCTLDHDLLNIEDYIKLNFITETKINQVYTIMNGSSGLYIESLGDGSSQLFEDNYTSEVIEDYRFVIDSFKKNPPNGRICILNGEPGTGKTHLIRSFLSELDNIFLIVPSNLISSLEKPDFLPLLVKIKNDYKKPIIMIVEDGDTCLVPRKSDNISTIAALLNISDGILGSLIDIKIIISTNANIKDMDEAIMRPGRLCKQIHVSALDSEQANRVYQRIINDSSKTLEHRKVGYTLAEIYHRANNLNNPTTIANKINSESKRTIGFHSRTESQDLKALNVAGK